MCVFPTFKKKLFQKYFQYCLSDKLGPTVFAPVKMDLVGNIKVNILTCLCRVYKGMVFTSFVFDKSKSEWGKSFTLGNFRSRMTEIAMMRDRSKPLVG